MTSRSQLFDVEITKIIFSYDVEITGEVEGRAPVPVLNVGVRQVPHRHDVMYFTRIHFQAGTLIDNELNVKPGTPLNMEVFVFFVLLFWHPVEHGGRTKLIPYSYSERSNVYLYFVNLYFCTSVFLNFCYHQVYLDSESSSVYGLMVTGMEVTDTRDQSEPILVNG